MQYVNSFFAGGGLSGDGERTYRVCEVARGGCLFACNFNVTWSTVLMEAETNK